MTHPGSCSLGDRVPVPGIFIFGTNNSHRGLGASLHGIVGYGFLFLGLFLFTATFYPFPIIGLFGDGARWQQAGGRCLGECAFGLLWREGGQFCFCESFAGGFECRPLIAVRPGYPLGSYGMAMGLSGGLLLHNRGYGRGLWDGLERRLGEASRGEGSLLSLREGLVGTTVYIHLCWFSLGDDGFRHRNGSIALSLKYLLSCRPARLLVAGGISASGL
ncbi:hypothetical protein F5144DRAFT_191761 [Chaetomium tenue]|uniref:Uncharacterized protein n=1 Tax=Chaetomium tenue TaxID=1854479 RepID=A0ACB7PGC8_9PEZI|nr:hypothetical protein F5144DRAFT_191761 [Chaetomium globosum]